MYAFKKKSQSLSEIVVSALSLYWQGLRSLWYWSLLLATLTSIPLMILGFFAREVHSYAILSIALLSLLVLWPILVFLVGYLIHEVFLIGTETKMSFEKSSAYVIKRLPRLMIALPVVSILTWLGTVFFIAPGIFISIVLIFVAPLILLDDYSFMDAFRYSWFLVWKSWWRTFAIFLIPFVLNVVISPFSYTSATYFSFTRVIINVIEMTLINPLFFSLMLTMYYDAKLRHHIPMHLPRKKKGHERVSES